MESLYQQLQLGQLTEYEAGLLNDEFPEHFLYSMLQLLCFLSQQEHIQDQICNVRVCKNHPMERIVGQIYLGKGHGKKGIGFIQN